MLRAIVVLVLLAVIVQNLKTMAPRLLSAPPDRATA
jgi:hypothetical protein